MFDKDTGKNLKKKFSYQDIKEVYVIVLFEESTKEFHNFPDYIHNSEQISDTGLKLNLLQKFIFIPLDIFKKRPHNKIIKNELEAWLTFLSADKPEEILQLIESYPKFRQIYQQVYDMCRNLETIMGLFSEELKILDRNTVQLMIDQMQDTINQQSEALAAKDEALAEKDDALQKAIARIKELEGPR